jgi:long-chain fatty acid transport protein
MTRNDAMDGGFTLHRHASPRFGIAVVALALTRGPEARASGFLNPRLADPHGHPALSNPYAVYFNPAALGGQRGTQLVVDGTLAFRTADYNRSASALSPNPAGSSLSDPVYAAANTGPAHAANVLGLPFVAASSDFGRPGFFAGIGVYMPFGGAVRFDQRLQFADTPRAPGAAGGSQRWAVISATQQSIYSTLVLGFRLAEAGLSFGIGSSLVWSRIKHTQARNLDGFDDTSTEGRTVLDVSGVDVALSAGIYWEVLPEDKLRLGASYQVRPALGRMRLSGTLLEQYGSDVSTEVDLLQSYPDVVRAGLAARVSSALELRLDAEYVTWSLFGRQCVVAKGRECAVGPHGEELSDPGSHIIFSVARAFRDAAAVRAGLGVFYDLDTEIYGSLGYDTSAVAGRTVDATYPDSFKILVSLGGRRQFSPLVALGASCTLVQYLATTTGHQVNSGLAGPSRFPNEDGEYSSRIVFFNLNGTFSF